MTTPGTTDKGTGRRRVIRPRPVIEEEPVKVLTREAEASFDDGSPEDEHDAEIDQLPDPDDDDSEDENDENENENEDDNENEEPRLKEEVTPDPGPVETLLVPPPIPPPAGPRKPSTPSGRRNEREQQLDDDFADVLANLDYSGNQHVVSLSRIEPEFDPRTRRKIRGYLERYSRAITMEDIKQQWGGGKYKLLVYGPSGVGRKQGLKYSKEVEIGGMDPIVPVSPFDTQRHENRHEEASVALTRSVLEKQEKMVDRVYEENKQLKDLVVSTLNTPKNEMMPFLEMFKEDSKRREEKERLDMERAKLDADERRRERDEQRREDDKRREDERRRRDDDQKERDRVHQREMEVLKMQMQKTSEDNKLAREESIRVSERSEKEKANQTQLMLGMMQENNKQLLLSMQSAQQQTLAGLAQVDNLKSQLFTDVLKAKDKGDPFDQMIKVKQMMELFEAGGGAEDKKERWEKIIDRISDAVPGMMAGAGVLMGNRNPGGAPVARPMVKAPPAQRLGPGVAAVVEIPPPRKQLPAKKKGLKPPQNTAAVPPQLPTTPLVVPQETEVVIEQPQAVAAPVDNGMKFPEESTEAGEMFVMLVQNIELALQQDWSASQIYKDVVKKFPVTALELLKSMPVENCLEIVKQKAPMEWLVNSMLGTNMIEKVYKLLKAGA